MMIKDSEIISTELNDTEIENKNKFKTYRLKDPVFGHLFKNGNEKLDRINKLQRNNKVITKQSMAQKPNLDNSRKVLPLESNLNFFKERMETRGKETNVKAANSQDTVFRQKLNVIKQNISQREKFQPLLDSNETETSYPSFDEYIDKMELDNIPESESPNIVNADCDFDYHSTVKTGNSQLDYFLHKKKTEPEFSYEFLQSFVTKSSTINQEESISCKFVNLGNNDQQLDSVDLKSYCSIKTHSKHLTFQVSKKVRTKSLTVVKDCNPISNLNEKVLSSSYDSSSKDDRQSSKIQTNVSPIVDVNYTNHRLDRTFTKYKKQPVSDEVHTKKILQRIHDIREVVEEKSFLPRHQSDNALQTRKDLFKLCNIRSNLENNFVTKIDIDDVIYHAKEASFDEENFEIEDVEFCRLSQDSFNVQQMIQDKYVLYNSENISWKSAICDLKSESQQKPAEPALKNETEPNDFKIKEVQPRKHIYDELLLHILPEVIDDAITLAKLSKFKNDKPLKEKTKNKNKIKPTVSSLRNLKKIETRLEDDVLSMLLDHSFTMISVSNQVLKNPQKEYKSDSEISELKSEDLGEAGKEEKCPKLKIQNHNERVNVSSKDESNISDQVKQTILIYDAKMRMLTEEKNSLRKENLEIIELNKSLHKRNGVLLTEFKQEKRETAFIKNQISVMLSRMQSIPEKLVQMETENSSLKSDISDLEKTLDQRDQLFTSERQMNVSLSEEIVKLESNSVNKELMKNVCEEFENLNEEYETLKKTLEETENKLFEIVQDRDNLIKHAKVMEDHLYKMKAENNYLIQNYQMMSSSGIVDSMNNNWSSDNRDNSHHAPNGQLRSIQSESCGVDSRHPEKAYNDQHRCSHSKYRGHIRSAHYTSSSESSDSSSCYSNSSSDSKKRRHKKRRKHSHKHKRRKSHSHKHSHKKKRSRKEDTEEDSKTGIENKNQNTNAVENSPQFVIEMPNSREDLKKLEIAYDKLQLKKSKLESALSHVPTNKSVSNTSNMTNMQEQVTLEENLDQCDQQLASLRKILKQCKVFKSIP